MADIVMTLDGEAVAQQVIVDLVASMWGELMDAGPSIYVIDTRTAFRPSPVSLSPLEAGSVMVELSGFHPDVESIHALISSRMRCDATDPLEGGGLRFFAHPYWEV